MTYLIKRIGHDEPLEFKTQKEAADFLGISVAKFRRIYKTNSDELVYKKQKKSLSYKEKYLEVKKDLKELVKKYNIVLKKLKKYE